MPQFFFKTPLTRTVLVVLACMVLLAGLWRMTANHQPTLSDLGDKLGIDFPRGDTFLIDKNVSREGSGISIQRVIAARDSELLKLDITTGISIEEALQKVEQRLNMLQSLYNNLPLPYPGMVTNTVLVEDTLRPKLHMINNEGIEIPLYILSSNARRTYGAIAQEMVVYRGGMCFLYDKAKRRLFRFDYFVPKASFDEPTLVAFFSNLRLQSGKPGDLTRLQPAETTAGQLQKTPAPVAKSRKQTEKQERYNLIVIAFEPLGAKHLGCYGYPQNTSPNLDRFAEEAVVFENAISPSSWSLPVFMSWFTSLYPSQHGVVNQYSKYTPTEQVTANLKDLSPHAETMAQVFKRHGYRTAAFTGGASLAAKFGFDQGFETYFDEKELAGFDLTMPKALDWVDAHAQEPFFLFVQGYDVHGQYPVNEAVLDRFLDPPYQGTLQKTAAAYWALRNQSLKEKTFSLPPEDLRLLKAMYDAKIFEADRRFGAFMDQIRQAGLLDNTLVVVSSGSGNEYMEHGHFDHGYSLYDELIRVPFILRIPGRHGRIAEQVRLIDLMPTVLDLLGLEPDPALQKQMQGVSLAPLLDGKTMSLDAISETDYLQHTFKRSIRTADGMKLIINLDNEERELYNLVNDPGEQVNLAADNPRLAYELEQKLFSVLRQRKSK